MAKAKLTNTQFQRNAAFVNSLKGQLQPFAPMNNIAQWSPSFKAYAELYGFRPLLLESDNYACGTVPAAGFDIACHYWACADARAEVVVCHGLFDHVGLYLPLVEFLLAHKCNVLAFDLPEHGLSSGKFGGLNDFCYYCDAVQGLLDEVLTDSALPRIGLGQSTGAAVLASLQLVENTPAFEALVLMAPLLRVRGWKQIKFAQRILAPWLKTLRRSFTANSHDRAFVEFLREHDPLQERRISTRWTAAMLKWEAGFDALPSCSRPALIIQGTGDQTVDFNHNLPRWQAKFEQVETAMVDGARHHLVGEAPAWRSQVFEAVAGFVDKQLGGTAAPKNNASKEAC